MRKIGRHKVAIKIPQGLMIGQADQMLPPDLPGSPHGRNFKGNTPYHGYQGTRQPAEQAKFS